MQRRFHFPVPNYVASLTGVNPKLLCSGFARIDTSMSFARAHTHGKCNSGKSTLLNALTKSAVFVENKLFATLDPATRRLILPDNTLVLLTDTVGFIKKLPTSLVAAFGATLEEVSVADGLVHVVDASHPNVLAHINSVYEVLGELQSIDKPMITVLNKADKVRGEDLTWLSNQVPNPVIVSALERTGFAELLTAMQTTSKSLRPKPQRSTA